MTPGGYAWWYLDALSEDGRDGLTVIAFIGSVFSPYYALARRKDPFDHCALNVALYRPRAGRWAMTERPRRRVEIAPDRFELGNSALSWDGETLTIDVRETCAPIPYPLRGRIIVRTGRLGGHVFDLDEARLHRWRPLAPDCEVEVDFSDPSVRWTGRGYLDFNQGEAPLEDGFAFWDWSRAEIGPGETAVLYNTVPREGAPQSLALRFGLDRSFERFEPPGEASLPTTSIWRIRRPLRAEKGAEPRVLKTLEDTPFYSRSVIESTVLGAPRRAVHESLSGDRLRARIVKAMLPFRMPRY